MGLSRRTIIINEDGFMFGCGRNTLGQLGLGNTTDVKKIRKLNDKKWKKVSCGTNHTLAVDENNKLFVCGDNSNGQLGLGNTTNKLIFTQVGTGNWKDVSAGGDFSVAIDSLGKIHTCGHNGEGQIGITGAFGGNNTEFKMINNTIFKGAQCGSKHVIAIDINNKMWTWGDGGDYATGVNTTVDQKAPVLVNDEKWNGMSAAPYNSFGVKENGDAYSWGGGYYYGTGQNTTAAIRQPQKMQIDEPIKKIGAGATFGVAVANSGFVYGWGTFFNAGVGPTDNPPTPTKINGLENIVDIVMVGDEHVILKDINGEMWALGVNMFYEFGDGTTENRLTPSVFRLGELIKKYLFSKSNTAYTIENGTLKSLGTITTANASTLFKNGVEAITKEHCALVGQQLGKAKVMRMLV